MENLIAAILQKTRDNEIEYRRDVDGLRGLSIALVVIYHFFPSVISGGYIGVDVFLVISGYIITRILYSRHKSQILQLRSFYISRCFRLLPNLLLLLITAYAVGYILLIPETYKTLGLNIFSTSVFMSNIFYYLNNSYFDAAKLNNPLIHLWSLSLEEQFYFFWPVLIKLNVKISNFIFLILALIILSFFSNIGMTAFDKDAAFYLIPFRFWEFLIGALIAVIEFKKIQKHEINQKLKNIITLFGILLIVSSAAMLDDHSTFPGSLALLPTLGAAAVIYFGEGTFINRYILANHIINFLGKISYSLYLWHWAILSFAYIIDRHEPNHDVKIFTLILSIIISAFIFYVVERPIRNKKGNIYYGIAIATAAVLISLLGLHLYWIEGSPGRIPENLRLALASNRTDEDYRVHSCFLYKSEKKELFDKCNDEISPDKKTIYLWGDSHAAHLYPGLDRYYKSQYNIIQRTSASCPPIDVDTLDADCFDKNNYSLAMIKKLKPEIVIVAGAWNQVPDHWLDVFRSIEKVRSYGVGQIYLVGPVPIWYNNLPQQLLLATTSSISHEVPYRLERGLIDDFVHIDFEMKKYSSDKTLKYVSVVDMLCNPDGCLTRLGDRADDLMTLDYGHFSRKASEYVVSKFPIP